MNLKKVENNLESEQEKNKKLEYELAKYETLSGLMDEIKSELVSEREKRYQAEKELAIIKESTK